MYNTGMKKHYKDNYYYKFFFQQFYYISQYTTQYECTSPRVTLHDVIPSSRWSMVLTHPDSRLTLSRIIRARTCVRTMNVPTRGSATSLVWSSPDSETTRG